VSTVEPENPNNVDGPDRDAGKLDRIAGEPDPAARDFDPNADEPTRTPGEPDPAARDFDRNADEPTRNAGEPDRAVRNLDRNADEPNRNPDRPDPAAREFDTHTFNTRTFSTPGERPAETIGSIPVDDVRRSPESLPASAERRPGTRIPDPTSIAAGVVFFLLGGAYLLASSGHLTVNAAWTISLLFIGLGLSGVLGAALADRRRR
jgi:hypothetical protein